MGILGEILANPDEIYPLLKLKMAIKKAKKMQIPPEPHWAFCYSTLNKVTKSFFLLIQQQGPELRDAMCVFYLILRALDTIGGTDEYKGLMDQFHHVSAAFLELKKGYQEAVVDTTKRMGVGMAKFLCKEVETVDDFDEYCHYAAGLVCLGLSKHFLASNLEVLTPDWEKLSNSMGLFSQKAHVIRDYFEDINEAPKSRMFWPREIWGKYVLKPEDLQYEENSSKAVQCLNEMVTNALVHIEDCLKYIDALRDPALFQSGAILQIMAFGSLALCYNNAKVFKGVVKMRRGLAAKIVDRTKTMADVYGAFYDFSCMLKAKVDKNDPNSVNTLNRIEVVQKVCRDSGVLHKSISQ
ncbi:hypothetical protein Bca52824_019082 [Brassica carinata]|uniref:Squalene synthase n=1 Tax=Brassica carinata TaxID=52824 RepID=A0A8X7VS87_BRACI|nr:hypothetical protein Bca52824_019082 [Brassica carinata]